MSLRLPSSVPEFAGTVTNAGIVTLPGIAETNTLIRLSASPPGAVNIPATATVLSGQASIGFNVAVVDNSTPQTNRTIWITASSDGYTNATASFAVLDDDPAALECSLVPSPQYVGVAFTNQLRALNPLGQQLSAGSFTVQLRIESQNLTNDVGTATIVNGQADTLITPPQPVRSATLVVEARGARDVSEPFNILASLDRILAGPIKDVAWADGVLYATVPDNAQANAGRIVTVNPATGEESSWALVSGGISSTSAFSGRIVAGPDGKTLFINAGPGGDIQAWDVASRSLSESYTLPSGQLCVDIAAGAGNPWRLVVDAAQANYQQAPGIVLDESLQPQSAPASRFFRSVIADPEIPETFYGFRPYRIDEWKTSDSGVASERMLRNGPYREGFLPMAVAEGKLFCADGYVCDLATTQAVGTLPVPSALVSSFWNGRIVADSVRREIVVASPSGAGVTRLQSFGTADLQLHRDVFVPMSMTNPRRLLFCDSNTLALVASNQLGLIHWPPGVGATNLPDLAAVPSPLPDGLTIGTNWSWSLTVTNSGQGVATDVRLRLSLPAQMSAVPNDVPGGRVLLDNGTVTVWLPQLDPGGAAVVSFTLDSLLGGWTTNQFSVSANEDEANLTNNSGAVVAYVGPSGIPDSIESLRLPVRELVPDAPRHQIYALERTPATNQTVLYRLDDQTLQPTALRVLTGVAARLRLSADHRFLYATERGGLGMARIDLNGVEPDLHFDLSDSAPSPGVVDLQVAPADSHTVVVITGAGGALATAYRDGVALPETISFTFPSSSADLEPDPATGLTLLARSREVSLLRTVSDGVVLAGQYSCDKAAGGFLVAEGRIYTGLGNEISAGDGRLLRDLPVTTSNLGLVCLDTNTDRLVLAYGGSAGSVQVYDRRSLGRLGITPLALSATIDCAALLPDERLALATQDGRVLLLNQSSISGTAPADLAVGWSLEPPTPKVGDPVQITITLTNNGPSNAVAPALTFESPASFVRQTAIPQPVRSVGNYFPYPLLWTNGVMRPGETRTFQVQGTFTAAGDLLLAVGAADRALDPSPGNNRVSLSLPVPYELARGQEALLNLKVIDAVRDPVRHGVLAIAADGESLAGRLVAVDPATGLMTGDWSIGPSPTRLVLADDDRTLYAIINGNTNVARVDIQNMSVESVLPAGQGTNSNLRFVEIAANPGAAEQFAAVRSDGMLGIYGTTNIVQPVNFDGGSLSFFAPDRMITPRNAYPFVLNRYRFDGSALLPDGSSRSFQIADLRTALGLVFAADGRLVDPFSLEQIGAFNSGGPAAVYSPANLVLFPGDYGLRAFDLSTQSLLESEVLGSSLNQSAVDLFHVADDLFVERKQNGQLIVMRTAAVPILPAADLGISPITAGTWRAGMICQWEATVTNPGPNTAIGARLDARLPAGMQFIEATAPVLSVAEPQVGMALGDLAPGESKTVRVKVLAQKASFGDGLIVSTRSEAVDPDLANNVAKTTEPIEFSQVPDRVDYASFPADNMIYEPIGKKLYVTSLEYSAAVSNVIVAIDPATGTIEKQAALPGRPGSLAVSDDGQFLYVSLDSAERVLRLTLPDLQSNLVFTTLRDDLPLPRPDCDMVVLPGLPETVAVSRFGGGSPSAAGVWIYDNGQPRQESVPGGYDGVTLLEPGTSANTLAALSGAQFRVLTIDSNGVSAQPVEGDSFDSSYAGFSVGGTNLLVGSELFNRSTFSKRSLLSASFTPDVTALSSSGDRVVLAAARNYAVNPILFAGFRADTSSPTGEARTDGMPYALEKLVLWGDDGVAAIGGDYIHSDRYLYLGRLDLAGPPSEDSDGDGMPDSWEASHGLTVGVNDAQGDLDQDGAANLLEYLSGTDPDSAGDVPTLSSSGPVENTLRLVFPCRGGAHFYVEKKTDLSAGNWTPVYDDVAPGGVEVYTVGIANSGSSYFRVRINP